MATAHINAKDGAFAKVVLMPGDPKRAEWIAKNYFHDVEMVCDVRGILGFTGYTKNNVKISVMASGMGMPSIGIYCRELFEGYGVETIIRIGTCGAYDPNCKLGDVILAQGACTDSNWMGQYGLYGGTYSAISTFEVLETAVNACRTLGRPWHSGNVLSADVFYDRDPNYWKKWASLGVLTVEMESYALYVTAAELKKKALGIFTVSDSFVTHESMTSEQRQTGLGNMVDVAILTAEKFA
ncbi:MAG: purine-nucleoside phosphorylase [Bacilli bacterium]|nr:purine-nucleoside phosphorylase [Bacilli bacterium]